MQKLQKIKRKLESQRHEKLVDLLQTLSQNGPFWVRAAPLRPGEEPVCTGQRTVYLCMYV